MNPINLDPSFLAALLVATGVYAIWNTIIRRKLLAKKPFDSLPMPPGHNVVTGHIHLMTSTANPAMPQLVTDCANEQGRTGFWIGHKPAMAVTHWEDARAILQAESNRDAPAVFKKHVGQMAGQNSILLLNGREWKIHRAAVRGSGAPHSAANDTQPETTNASSHSNSFVCADQQSVHSRRLEVIP